MWRGAMKNHQEPDWEKLISDTIESELHSGDFTQLKQTLGTTFETVKKQTAEGLKRIDVQTEKALQTGLNAMLKGRTSFIIAHRLSTIRNCDKIMYIDNGGIMESGTHDELMAKKGHYYKLYTACLLYTSRCV